MGFKRVSVHVDQLRPGMIVAVQGSGTPTRMIYKVGSNFNNRTNGWISFIWAIHGHLDENTLEWHEYCTMTEKLCERITSIIEIVDGKKISTPVTVIGRQPHEQGNEHEQLNTVYNYTGYDVLNPSGCV